MDRRTVLAVLAVVALHAVALVGLAAYSGHIRPPPPLPAAVVMADLIEPAQPMPAVAPIAAPTSVAPVAAPKQPKAATIPPTPTANTAPTPQPSSAQTTPAEKPTPPAPKPIAVTDDKAVASSAKSADAPLTAATSGENSAAKSNASAERSPSAAAGDANPKVEPPSSSAAHLNNPKPPYPPASRRLNEQGTVIVRVLIGADGRAQDAELKTSSGYDRLDDAAVQAVRQWRYVPGKRSGVPEAMWHNVPVHFELKPST